MDNIQYTWGIAQQDALKNIIPHLMEVEEILQKDFGDDRASAYYVTFAMLTQLLKDLGWSKEQLFRAIRNEVPKP